MKPYLLLSTACLVVVAIHAPAAPVGAPADSAGLPDLLDPQNLTAWCVVPFDARKRGPEQRAEMLQRLGFRSFAYDWRAEHVPTFDAEVEALKKHGINLAAWWFPTEAGDPNARLILEVIKRHSIHPQLWVMGSGSPTKTDAEQRQRIEQEAERIRKIVELAAPYGCPVELYNHNGWFGQPDNEAAVIERLKQLDAGGVGMVYNFSHGHADVANFPAIWKRIQRYVVAVNVTGMVADERLIPPWQGDHELAMLRTIQQSGWRGPIGLIAEQGGDAEVTLGQNLRGLEQLRKDLAQPSSEALPLKTAVSQYGITWTFEKPTRVGQFINGDWYVVGPVNVIRIDPAPRYGSEVTDDELDGREKVPLEQRCRNGSMLNAPPRQEVAWDSGILNYYHPEHRARLPIAMQPGDSLASSISLRQGEKVTYTYHPGTVRGEGDNSPVKVVAVLTCVAEPLPADAFRPGYCGHDPGIYLARHLKRELLPRFDQPREAPDPARFADLIQRPWCDAGFFSFDVPQESMPNYAQAYAQVLADAVLLACCAGTRPEDKERLLINVVQIGIDHYSLVRHGHPGWAAHGGHGSGRKFPIVFAGAMLGDEAMANINRSFPQAHFGEDEQTAYGDCWTGAKVVFTGHSGIDQVTGVGRDFVRAGNPWGPYEHLPPDKWVPEEFRSEAYRRANTSTCFVAQALVLRAMQLEGAWHHDAFFDYVDRWMFEDDKPFRVEIAKHCHPPYDPNDYLDETKDWFHEGYADRPWIKQLWNQYRPLSHAPTDGWKQKHDDSYYRDAAAKQRKQP